MRRESVELRQIKDNNFALLRLLFSVLVVLSHSPDLAGADPATDPILRIKAFVPLGSLSMMGFFSISGYLITKSYLDSVTVQQYLLKRVLRIYPAFAICFLLCVFVVAPLSGSPVSRYSPALILIHVTELLYLTPPLAPQTFQGMPFPLLDGSMWSLAYEFRCYLLVIGLGALGVFQTRSGKSAMACIALACIALDCSGVMKAVPIVQQDLLGRPVFDVRFLGAFAMGSCYFLYRDHIRYSGLLALLACAGLLPFLSTEFLSEGPLPILGGYVVFWIALAAPTLRLSRLANKVDLSYGIYLCAWPIQNLIIWNDRTINTTLLFVLSLLAAVTLAAISWTFIEKPSLRLARAPHFGSRAGDLTLVHSEASPV